MLALFIASFISIPDNKLIFLDPKTTQPIKLIIMLDTGAEELEEVVVRSKPIAWTPIMDGQPGALVYVGYYFTIDLKDDAGKTIVPVGCFVSSFDEKPDFRRKEQAFVTVSKQTIDADGRWDTACMGEKRYKKVKKINRIRDAVLQIFRSVSNVLAAIVKWASI